MKENTVSKEELYKRLAASSGKEGVYYAVRFPTRWRLYALPWVDFGDIWHGVAWKSYIVPALVESWTQSGVTAAQLSPLFKGFPRGRVERVVPGEFTVYHADDLPSSISKGGVEAAFELGAQKVAWTLDPHEQTDAGQKELLRMLLKLDEVW